jgi:hypothetical protein
MEFSENTDPPLHYKHADLPRIESIVAEQQGPKRLPMPERKMLYDAVIAAAQL